MRATRRKPSCRGPSGVIWAAVLMLGACATAPPPGDAEPEVPVIEASAPAPSTEVATDEVMQTVEAAPEPSPAQDEPPPPAAAPGDTPLSVDPASASEPAADTAEPAQEVPRASPPSPKPAAPPAPASVDKPAEPQAQAVTPSASAAPKPESPAPEAAKKPQMDLDSLESRLRQTKAIGVFTKLELKSQVNDLLKDVENYHRKRSSMSLTQLEEHFNLLVMKLLVLLEKEDPQLHRDIARARPALWSTLADPDEFSSMKGP